MKKENVLILGASAKPDRYSNMAMNRLHEHGHQTVLVSPSVAEINKQKVYPNLESARIDLKSPIDTITVYVNPDISTPLVQDMIKLKPKRIIFNPGTENLNIEEALKKTGIDVIHACTLVMLSTKQF